MSLKINNWKKVIIRSIVAVIALIFVALFIKVAIWEAKYYSEKEGSERTAAVVSEEILDESEISEAQITEYTVPAENPRYITIPKLNVTKARVIQVSLKTNKELGTPNNIYDVGWYNASGKPGEGGTLMLDGHNGGPTKYGIFKNLPNLVEGDIITIERGDGEIFNYKVVENKTITIEEAANYMNTALHYNKKSKKESLSIITCTGEWSASQSTYLSRQFTHAVLEK